MANILIIDDDKMICDAMSKVVTRMGHEVAHANTLKEGLSLASASSCDIVFLDVRMPDGNGLHMLPQIQGVHSSPEVIIITGSGDPDGAELAIKSGAWDYIEKPVSVKEMTLPLLRALQYRQERKAQKPPVALKLDGIIGKSHQMKSSFDLLAQAADSETSVLLTGETGTGKELFAKAIHLNSSRREQNFIVVDCAALPDTLIESMLFGHERGAFTGAEKAKEGLIKQADKGTLFLDEVGELPLSLQKAFLRVLQERRFRPIGSRREVESDFRLVAATNRDLDEMVYQDRFRSDLLYRLKSFPIELPPLRERPEDIKELIIHYTARICERYHIGTKGFSSDFFIAMNAYQWPGNVRELINIIERSIISARHEPTLFPKHLPINIRVKIARASITKESSSKGVLKEDNHKPFIDDLTQPLPTLQNYRENKDQQYLLKLMSLSDWNIEKACQISGLSRSRLYALLQKYKLSKHG